MKLEPIASGEHSEAVAMGMMASRFRGISHLPRDIIGVSFVFVRENLVMIDEVTTM
jgi:hypothetical protein